MSRKIKLIISIALLSLALYAVYFWIVERNSVRLRYLNQWPKIEKQSFIITEALSEIGKVSIVRGNSYDMLLDGVFGNKKISIKNNSINVFYTGEALPAKLNGYDLSLGFDDITSHNYMRLPVYYLTNHNPKYNINFNRYKQRGKCDPQSKKRFACFLVSNSGHSHYFSSLNYNGCEARNRMFHLLSLYKPVSSGGKFLNTEGGPIPPKKTEEWLAGCKFVIAYENNLDVPYYVTEKAFNAYYAGAIPIYNAHPTYVKDINPEAVIYAGNFTSEAEVVEYIKKVDQDDELYCKIWEKNILISPEQDYDKVKARLKAHFERLLAEKKPELLKRLRKEKIDK